MHWQTNSKFEDANVGMPDSMVLSVFQVSVVVLCDRDKSVNLHVLALIPNLTVKNPSLKINNFLGYDVRRLLDMNF